MSPAHRVHLKPNGYQFNISGDRPLLFELADQGILLRSDCGGKGKCKKCQVSIERDGNDVDPVEACTFRVTENLTLSIPEASRLSSGIIDKAPLLLPKSYMPLRPSFGEEQSYGVAIDLGTTTIALYLCELQTATVLSSLAIKNPQSIYGDDVMSRISAINGFRGKTALLQKPLVTFIDHTLSQLCEMTNVDVSSLVDLVVAGNPTMIHILAGENPESIGISPYRPVFTEFQELSADKLGFSFYRGRLLTLPLVSGFIGADTVAAILAIDLENQPTGTLLVDLGTNGEIVLLGENRMYATSCATGPAFEGATLSCGMQATFGAIDRVEIDDCNTAPRCRVITDTILIRKTRLRRKTRPVGICGSGIVSALAAFIRTGIVDSSGLFNKVNLIPSLKKDAENRIYYELVSGKDSGNGSSISISQKDIRAVQLGKAALRAGIDHLLKVADLRNLEKILVAGAFGSHIDPSDMISLGMLPNISTDRIQTVGNAAGSGTVMALCNSDYFKKASHVALTISNVDLATNAGFQKTFIDRLKFPDNM
ncbi:MAG: hypothetical protein ACD_75C01616G0004 [uncultured bacterium]|nr:MAG: hypothetical protein ACD_75C01616G0004 [uncultured bacterium]